MNETAKDTPAQEKQEEDLQRKGHQIHALHHGPRCQCLTCRLDRYKSVHGEYWFTSWFHHLIPNHYGGSLVLGALLTGGALAWIGTSMWQQWKTTAFASFSCKTPFSRVVTSEPSVLINDVQDVVYHGMTTDRSLGIQYIPRTGIWTIMVHICAQWDLKTTNPSTLLSPSHKLLTSIVRNGLPNDSYCVLRTRETNISTMHPFEVLLFFQVLLTKEDYIQVFAVDEGAPDSLALRINSVEWMTRMDCQSYV
jgi:hypothetical protein